MVFAVTIPPGSSGIILVLQNSHPPELIWKAKISYCRPNNNFNNKGEESEQSQL